MMGIAASEGGGQQWMDKKAYSHDVAKARVLVP